MQKGIEVNFIDLFRYLIKRWFVLLIFAVVFGAAANCYGFHRLSAAANEERRALDAYAAEHDTTVEQLPEHVTAELTALRSALTEEEASFVEATAKLYMYRMWASDRINGELVVGEPDQGDLEMVQTLYYANEGVQSAVQVMTSAEKSYYNVLVKQLSGTDMSMTEKTISSPGLVQPKWILIGIVCGVFLGILFLAMNYTLSGKLRVAQDLEIPLGIPVLETIKSGNEAEKLEAVAKGIHRLLESSGQSSLFISFVDTPRARTVSDSVAKAFSEESITVSSAPNDTGPFIADISDAGAVLFVEEIGKSRYTDIKARVSACRKFSVPTVGGIVIQ